MREGFRKFASQAATVMGSPGAFLTACSLVVVWAAAGPIFGFNDRWQLVANTGTTLVTFLVVFLVQATQNRDARALHLKLDELVRTSKARNIFADLEDATDEEIDNLRAEFKEWREKWGHLQEDDPTVPGRAP